MRDRRYLGASSIFSPFWLNRRCMSGSVFKYMLSSKNKFCIEPSNSCTRCVTCIKRVVIRKCIDLGHDKFNEELREGIALKLVGILDRGLEQRRRVLLPAVH